MGVCTDSRGVSDDPTWPRAQEVYPPAPTVSLTTRPTRPHRSTPLRRSPYEADGALDATASTDISPSVLGARGTTAHRVSASPKKRRKRRKTMITGRVHHSLVCRTWTWTRPYLSRVSAPHPAQTRGLTVGWVDRGRAATDRAVAPSHSDPGLTTRPFKTRPPPSPPPLWPHHSPATWHTPPSDNTTSGLVTRT